MRKESDGFEMRKASFVLMDKQERDRQRGYRRRREILGEQGLASEFAFQTEQEGLV